MSEVENDYVATAAARQRLNEILTSKLDEDLAALVAEILLAGTKIEYKPRLKAVLVTIPLPDTATVTRPEMTKEDAVKELAAGAERARDVYDQAEDALGRGSADTPKPARFGLFEPSVTSNPDYHEDDFFVG